MNAILNLIKPLSLPIEDDSDEGRYARLKQAVKQATADHAADAPKWERYVAEQRAAEKQDEELAALRQRLAHVIACEELDKRAPEDRSVLEKAIQAAIEEAKEKRARAAIATEGIAMLTKDRDAIAARREAAASQLQPLLAKVAYNRVGEYAPIFDKAVADFSNVLVEMFARCKTSDLAAKEAPGHSDFTNAGRIYDLALPMPRHPAFKASRRDIGLEVDQRAALVLEELQR